MFKNLASERFRAKPHGPVYLLAAFFLFALIIFPAVAQPSPPSSDAEVKAAYLLNFGRFMRHATPPAPRSSFDICILGQDSIGRAIDDIAANESIEHLPVHIRRLPDVTDAKGCAILFISATGGDEIREDLAILGSSDVLTVSDASDFLERGGMIRFLLVDNHVRFAVNLNSVNRVHLVLSSELLRVAVSVTGKPSAEDAP